MNQLVIVKKWGWLAVVLLCWGLLGCNRESKRPSTPLPALTQTPVPPQLSLLPTPSPTTSEPVPLPDFTDVPAEDLIFDGNRAYVAAGKAGLFLYDMTAEGEATAVTAFNVEATQLHLHHNFLYVVGCNHQCVYQIALPTDRLPQLPGDSYNTHFFSHIQAIAIHEGYMYLAVEHSLIKVVDIQQRPWQVVNEYTLPDEIVALASQQDFLYATVRHQGIFLLDIAQAPTITEQDFAPVPKSVVYEETPGDVWDSAVSGEQVYMAAGQKGVRVLFHSPNSEQREQIDFWGPYFYYVQGEARQVVWQTPFLYVKSWDEASGQYYLTILKHLLEGGTRRIPILQIGEYELTADPGKIVVWNNRIYFAGEQITLFEEAGDYEVVAGTHPISDTIVVSPTQQLQFVKRIGGNLVSLAVKEQYAYVGLEHDFYVLDVTNPAAPLEVSRLSFSEQINEIKVNGNYAYLRMEGFEWGYLLVLDISDPANPVEVVKYGRFVQDIELEGNLAYIISGYYTARTTFTILNVTNPANITELGSFTTPEREDAATDNGISVAWANQYSMWDFAISGNYAYIAWGDDFSCQSLDCAGGLLILDITDKAAPKETGIYLHGAVLSSVVVENDMAYTIDQYGQIVTIDVSDKSAPSPFAILEAEVEGLPEKQMLLNGRILSIADGNNGLRRFDVGNLPVISEISGYRTGAVVRTAVSQNDKLFLVSSGSGLEILQQDATNPLQPVNSYPPPITASDVLFHQQATYIADNERGLHIWDSTDRLNPISLAIIEGTAYPQQLGLSGDLLYATTVSNTIDIFDVNQPLQPNYHLTLPFTATYFSIHNNIGYATQENRLTLWQLDNLEAPQLIGSYEAPGELWRNIAVADQFIYVSVAGRVIFVLDANDFSNIHPVYAINEVQGLNSIVFGSWDLQAEGNRLYSICDWSGICIYDITNPAQPQFLGVGGGIARSFEASHERLYALIELSQVTNEISLAMLEMRESDGRIIEHLPAGYRIGFGFGSYIPVGIAIVDDIVYAALGESGLVIFESRPEASE